MQCYPFVALCKGACWSDPSHQVPQKRPLQVLASTSGNFMYSSPIPGPSKRHQRRARSPSKRVAHLSSYQASTRAKWNAAFLIALGVLVYFGVWDLLLNVLQLVLDSKVVRVISEFTREFQWI